MLRIYSKTLLTFLLVINAYIGTAFSQTLFRVLDQHNQPLANAVIDVTNFNSKNSENIANTSTKKRPIYVMDQVRKQFDPFVLVVPHSSSVSFPNSDDIRHHVYSFSPTKPFQLKLYAGEPKKPIFFRQPGIVVLGCNIHDAMVGYIYVAEQSHVYLSDENGVIKAPYPLTEIEDLKLWHPYAAAGVEHRESYSKENFKVVDGEVTLVINTNLPALRDSFENLIKK